MNEIVWQDPPITGGQSRRGEVQALVESVKSRPGEWALVYVSTFPSWGANVKRRFPGIEATVRSRPDGRFDCYLRWVGEP